VAAEQAKVRAAREATEAEKRKRQEETAAKKAALAAQVAARAPVPPSPPAAAAPPSAVAAAAPPADAAAAAALLAGFSIPAAAAPAAAPAPAAAAGTKSWGSVQHVTGGAAELRNLLSAAAAAGALCVVDWSMAGRHHTPVVRLTKTSACGIRSSLDLTTRSYERVLCVTFGGLTTCCHHGVLWSVRHGHLRAVPAYRAAVRGAGCRAPRRALRGRGHWRQRGQRCGGAGGRRAGVPHVPSVHRHAARGGAGGGRLGAPRVAHRAALPGAGADGLCPCRYSCCRHCHRRGRG
jgi:hypothetical protein